MCFRRFRPPPIVDEAEGGGSNDNNVVATVDGTEYTDIQEAITAAAPDRTVTLTSDVAVNEWIMFSQNLTLANKLITIDMNGLTIDGNNCTLTVNNVISGSNGGYLFHNADNLTVKNLNIVMSINASTVGGISLKSGTIENVTFSGSSTGIVTGAGIVNITGCTFNDGAGIYVNEDGLGTQSIKSCTFNGEKDDYAVILRNPNSTFTGNTCNTKVNLTGNDLAKNVTGNTFKNRVKLYTNNETLTNNAFGAGGYVEVDSKITDKTSIDVSGNYWDGGVPSSSQVPSGITCGSFYTSFTTNEKGVIVMEESSLVEITSSDLDNCYLITFNSAGGSSVSSITVENGKSFGKLPVPIKNGYEFDGWYTSPYGGKKITESTIVNLTDDQILYAHWTPVPSSDYPIIPDYPHRPSNTSGNGDSLSDSIVFIMLIGALVGVIVFFGHVVLRK